MRVFKNLFGDGSKIHADEIIVGSKGSHQLLSDKFANFLPQSVLSYRQSGTRTIKLERGAGYIVVTSGQVAVLNSIHLIGSTSSQQLVTPVLTGASVTVSIDADMLLTITTSGTATVGVIRFG